MTPLSKCSAAGQDAVYHAINALLARIGIDGQVDGQAPEVSAMMSALSDIDGGVYKRGPDPLDEALNMGDGAYRP